MAKKQSLCDLRTGAEAAGGVNPRQSACDDDINRIRNDVEILLYMQESCTCDCAGNCRRQEAQERFFRRYQASIRRFLSGILRDQLLVDEAFQQFALKFVEGKLGGYKEKKGLFRDYLKQVLRNEARKTLIRARSNPHRVDLDVAVAPLVRDAATEFDDQLRKELLCRAFDRLKETEHEGKPRDFSLLKWLWNQESSTIAPISTKQIATFLEQQDGEPCSFENARQRKKRARQRLAEQLIAVTGELIHSRNLERIAETLQDLELSIYCKPFLVEQR